jgi:two-component system, NarL family, sensor kinase
MTVAPGPGASRRRIPGFRSRTWRGSVPLGRELVTFLAVALLVLLVTSAGAMWMSERIARDRALDEAERTTERLARLTVSPALTAALAQGSDRYEELDRLFQDRPTDGSPTRAVVRRPSGDVVYASDSGLEAGSAPDAKVRAAAAGETVSDVGDNADTDGDDPAEALLEVYTPLDVDGERLVLEMYFPNETLDQQAAMLRGELLPMAVGALVLLQVVQIPIATSLARRVSRQEAERAELIERQITASDRERRAIAADVHDGPVQDLAGVSYALSALRGSLPPERQPTADRLVGAVQHAVQSLRRLMIDIYPPDLSGAGLGTAIGDLAGELRAQGIEALVDAGPLPDMTPDAAAVLYRTAKEALTNVVHHSKATRAWIVLEETEWRGVPAVHLEIADDGVGFREEGLDRRREGHFGLAFLRERVVDVGGAVTLGARDGGGAVLTAVVPLSREGESPARPSADGR